MSTNAMVNSDITPIVAIKSGAQVKIDQPEINQDVSPATFELVVSYYQTEIMPRIEVLNGVLLQLQTRDINMNSRMQIMKIQTQSVHDQLSGKQIIMKALPNMVNK